MTQLLVLMSDGEMNVILAETLDADSLSIAGAFQRYTSKGVCATFDNGIHSRQVEDRGLQQRLHALFC
jgi:hypothetical protein